MNNFSCKYVNDVKIRYFSPLATLYLQFDFEKEKRKKLLFTDDLLSQDFPIVRIRVYKLFLQKNKEVIFEQI